MITINSSDVRKQWSTVMDLVAHSKPAFIKRTHDCLLLCDMNTVSALVSDVKYKANLFYENDGSVTLSLKNMDIISHGEDIKAAKEALALNIIEYAEEYYSEFEVYSKTPNRSKHLPYVIKALMAKNPEELESDIVCQSGKN